jgi:hypothetical protein
LLAQAFCPTFGFAGKLWILAFLCLDGAHTYDECYSKK